MAFIVFINEVGAAGWKSKSDNTNQILASFGFMLISIGWSYSNYTVMIFTDAKSNTACRKCWGPWVWLCLSKECIGLARSLHRLGQSFFRTLLLMIFTLVYLQSLGRQLRDHIARNPYHLWHCAAVKNLMSGISGLLIIRCLPQVYWMFRSLVLRVALQSSIYRWLVANPLI